MSPEFTQRGEKRKQILEHALSTLKNMAQREEDEATELLKSLSSFDGPWQSKQPDEMIKLEYRVNLHDHQHVAYREKSLQLQEILSSGGNESEKVEAGSVFVWDFSDPESSVKDETVIVIPSGGGKFGDFRLLSLSAPLTKAVIGKKAGDKVRFGEVKVTIREVI